MNSCTECLATHATEVNAMFDWLAREGVKLSYQRGLEGLRYVVFEAPTWKLMQVIQGPPLTGALELYRRVCAPQSSCLSSVEANQWTDEST